MEQLEKSRIYGRLHADHFRNGVKIDERDTPNLIVTTGKAAIAGLINGVGSVAYFAWCGVGIGTTGPVAGNTTLETEREVDGTADATHTASVTSLVTTTVTNDTAQFVTTFNFTATLAITESGLFNALDDGTMLARQTFAALNVVSGDSIVITWKVQAT